MVPTWTGRVLRGGLLRLDRPADYNRYVRTFSDQFIELVIRKRKQQRSGQANRRYWGYIVPEIAEASGFTKDEAHEAMKHHFLKQPGEGPLVKIRSTADLSVEEFSEYTERCQVLGAEMFGIVWE